MILLLLHLNLEEIDFLKSTALLSGYIEILQFLLFNIFSTLGLTPNADSLADNLINLKDMLK